MKDFLTYVWKLFALGTGSAIAWIGRHAQNILFTLGFLAITVGFALLHVSLGLIVPGFLICGLLVWSRVRATTRQPGDDNA